MKISDKTLALSFLAILTCSGVALARNADVRLRISQMEDDEKVVTRDNLQKIKQFILQNGRRETYCNKFNNNPAYHTKEFQLYLDPDAGQLNGNCDPAKSDFNTLTIRSTNGGKNQYRKVEFIDQHSIHVVASWPTDDLTVGQLRKFVEEALTQILAEMDQKKPKNKLEAAQGESKKPNTPLHPTAGNAPV